MKAGTGEIEYHIVECQKSSLESQKFSFKANWRIRGLLLVETMRPKLPGLRTCPVTRSILPPEANKALRLLIGFAKFGWLNRLKNSARNSNLRDSARGKSFAMEKSKFTCRGPRKQFRPRLPMSVPAAEAVAAPPELGMG